MKKKILEVCIDSVESALAAEAGGASRLELCGNLMIGGTTPTMALLDVVKAHVNIPVYVLIRPRFGDFCYTNFEFEQIKREVIDAKAHGAEGVVIGILNPDGSLDIEKMKQLVELAKPLHITLHRAFDVCKHPLETLEVIKELGIHTILTSGQEQTCEQGKALLAELVRRAGDEVEILVGSGLKSNNLEEMIQMTGAQAYHLSGKKEVESQMSYRPKEVSMGLPILSEYIIWRTDEEEIRKVRTILDRY